MTREVQTERLTKVGNVKFKSSSEIKRSILGIGFEKLDRGVFDPHKAYDKVAATGMTKRVLGSRLLEFTPHTFLPIGKNNVKNKLSRGDGKDK